MGGIVGFVVGPVTHGRTPRLAPQSSSASRLTAGAAGFLILSQSLSRPERYVEPSRLDTMLSQPGAQAGL
jgi:hypothetical protein